MGHVILESRISINLNKIEAVVNWPRLTNITEIRSFLILAGYHQKFVEDFGTLASPFTWLTQKRVKFDGHQLVRKVYKN